MITLYVFYVRRCGTCAGSELIPARTVKAIINRKTYGVMSGGLINEICEALDEGGIKYDASTKGRGFVTVPRFQKIGD